MGVEEQIKSTGAAVASAVTGKKPEDEKVAKTGTTTGNALAVPANKTLDIDTTGWKLNLIPISFSLEDQIRKATFTVTNLSKTPGSRLDRKFVEGLIRQADGLAFISVVRGGLIVSGQVGTGLVITRKDGKWSAPSAIISLGTGLGLQWGINQTDAVLIFRTAEAATAFQGTHVAVGASAGLSFGLGRQAEGEYHIQLGKRKLALTYGWSQSKGFYGGGSLDGTIITTRNSVNKTFYGKEVDASDLLDFKVDPPAAAMPLYDALAKLTAETE